MRTTFGVITLFILTSILTACGGGGGTPAAPPTNQSRASSVDLSSAATLSSAETSSDAQRSVNSPQTSSESSSSKSPSNDAAASSMGISSSSLAQRVSNINIGKMNDAELHLWQKIWTHEVQNLSDNFLQLLNYETILQEKKLIDSITIPLNIRLSHICDEDDDLISLYLISNNHQYFYGQCIKITGEYQLNDGSIGYYYGATQAALFDANGVIHTQSSPPFDSGVVSLTNEGQLFRTNVYDKTPPPIEKYLIENEEWETFQQKIPALSGYSTIRPSEDGVHFFSSGWYLWSTQSYNFKTESISVVGANGSVTTVPNNLITESAIEYIVSEENGTIAYRFEREALYNWLKATINMSNPSVITYRSLDRSGGFNSTLGIENDAIITVIGDYDKTNQSFSNAHKISVPYSELKQFSSLMNAYAPSNNNGDYGTGGGDINLSQCDQAWTGSPDDVQVSLQCKTACIYDLTNTTDGLTATCQIIAGWNATSSCQPCK